MNEILTIGSFDCLHSGHVDFLQHLSALGNVTVALNTDSFIERFKGKPLFNYSERLSHLERLGYKVVCNSGDEDATQVIRMVRPNYLAIGSDWAYRDYYKQLGLTHKWLDEHNIGLIYVSRPGDISTSIIKERVRGLR